MRWVSAPFYAGAVSDLPPPGEDQDVESWIAYSRDDPPGRRVHPLTILVIVLAIGVGGGLFLLRPDAQRLDEARSQLSVIGVPSDIYDAVVVGVAAGPCGQAPDSDCLNVSFEIEAGPDAGAVHEQSFVAGGTTPDFSVGDDVVLSYIPPDGRVVSAVVDTCSFAPDSNCVNLTFLLDIGPASGSLASYEADVTDPAALLLVGEPAVITYFTEDDGTPTVIGAGPVDVQYQYQYADFQRRPALLLVALVFALVVVGFGGFRGFASLAGLIASLGVILLFVLPAIVSGRSPVAVAVIGAAAVAYLALYLAHGFRMMTTVALLGTLAALTLTAVLSAVVATLASVSGFVTEESTLLTLFEGLDVRGLLLAGVVLGAAGAIDDVTVTQASAVAELRRANPGLSRLDLVRAGLRIGRDHIASTVNTLLLAYAGASLPLLVLFVLSEQSLGAIANGEVVAVEIIRTLVGSIGLVAAVPITTWLAAVFAADLEPVH